MKFYGRNNCKIPLDLVIGKHEQIVLSVLSNLTEDVNSRLFFTFVSRKTTEKKVMKFVKDNEMILEKIGTSIVKEEEMDDRPIWFDMDNKENISNKARFTKEVKNVEDIIQGIFFLEGLTKFIYVFMEKKFMNKLHLTSVKVLKDLYKEFKYEALRSDQTLQKVVNRSLFKYVSDPEFRQQIDEEVSLTISGSNL